MGSHTTPPCEENTYHMILTKPLTMSGCQFKLLRESSLISNKPKNLHARLEQPINDRTLYIYDTAKMIYIKNISSMIPPEFNKYLLKKGGFKRKHRIVCTKKGCFKRSLRSKKLYCELPNDMHKDNFKVDW
jgi:hypothetical protein